MSIEFHCDHCQQLLRVPDGSGGKKTRCPSCHSELPIPESSETQSTFSTADFNFEAKPPQNEFAELGGVDPGSAPVVASSNPYAAPAVGSEATSAMWVDSIGPADLKHTRADFADVMTIPYDLLSKHNPGKCALMGLIVIAIHLATTWIVEFIWGLLMFSAGMGGAVVLYLAGQFVILMVDSWLWLAGILFALTLVREGKARLECLLNCGPYFWKAMVLQLALLGLFLIIAVAVMLPVGAMAAFTFDPGVSSVIAGVGQLILLVMIGFLSLKYCIALQFQVDRNLGTIEALKMSYHYMTGNMLAVFGAGLLSGILAGLVIIITCGIGSVIVVPYYILFGTVLYLLVTGQSTRPPQPTTTHIQVTPLP